ncbi:MAG: Hpt domain-containing protein, partial [Deltaproteobacteria bacterium]
VEHSEQEMEQQEVNDLSESPPETTPSGPTQELPAASLRSTCDELMIEENPEEFLQDTELLSGFIDESIEHLESIEASVLELEHNPGDLEIINNIFRPFHTIKGVSGFLNLKAINALAHSVENLLDDVRNGVHPMDSAVIDIVLGVGDFLRSMIENIKEVLEGGAEKYRPFDICDYTRRIKEIQSGTKVQSDAVIGKEEEEGTGQAAEASAPEGSSCEAEKIEAEEEAEGQGRASSFSTLTLSMRLGSW